MPEIKPDRKSRRWSAGLIRLLARLPLPLLYAIADTLYFLFFHVFRFQRKLVVENLSDAFPDRPADEIRKLAAKTYRNAIHILFEGIGGLAFSADELEQHVEIRNPQLIDKLLQQHRTILAAAAHQGNWEWLQLACASRLDAPIAALYKPLNHGAIDELLLRMRGRFGSHLVEAKSALPGLLSFSRPGGVIALVADQGPRPDEDKYWSRLLDRDTAFYPGLEKLARLLKAPVVFVHMKRLCRGRYRIDFELLSEPPYEQAYGSIMELYIRAVEQQIRETPEDWFWVYKRWKYKRSVYDA